MILVSVYRVWGSLKTKMIKKVTWILLNTVMKLYVHLVCTCASCRYINCTREGKKKRDTNSYFLIWIIRWEQPFLLEYNKIHVIIPINYTRKLNFIPEFHRNQTKDQVCILRGSVVVLRVMLQVSAWVALNSEVQRSYYRS